MLNAILHSTHERPIGRLKFLSPAATIKTEFRYYAHYDYILKAERVIEDQEIISPAPTIEHQAYNREVWEKPCHSDTSSLQGHMVAFD